jgi:HrpA-like RNA helicase
LKQRRGRAGRVREGTCYKLISRTTFDTLKEHSEPEIQRVALDQTLLQLIYIGVEPRIGLFTNTLLDPPNKGSLEAAIFSLRKIGAVERGPNDEVVATPLGAHLASIPAPPLVGKRTCCSFVPKFERVCFSKRPILSSLFLFSACYGLHTWLPKCRAGNGGRNMLGAQLLY